jgi:Sulfotransferase domain
MIRSPKVAPARRRPSILRKWLFGLTVVAFYVTMFSETLVWNDMIRIHFTELNSSHVGELPSLLLPAIQGLSFISVDSPGSKHDIEDAWNLQASNMESADTGELFRQRKSTEIGVSAKPAHFDQHPFDPARNQRRTLIGSSDKLVLPQSSAVGGSPVKSVNERGGLMYPAGQVNPGTLTPVKSVNERGGLMYPAGKVNPGIPGEDVDKDEGDRNEGAKQSTSAVDEASPRIALISAIQSTTNVTSVSPEQKSEKVENINHFEGCDLDDTSSSSKKSMSNRITRESPVFVLSLPNNGGVSIQHYFKCSGLDERTIGRLFTTKDLCNANLYKRRTIGKCMWGNIRRAYMENRSIDPLADCGEHLVWTEMEYISKSSPAEFNALGRRACFFPTMQSYALQNLFDAYPNATVIHVRRDPEEWYKTLSPGEKERWPRWCNHGTAVENAVLQFPEANATKEEWIHFYEQHTKFVRRHAEEHPSITFIDVDLETNASETSRTLNQRLGIPESCWTDRALRKDNRPRDIRYPIFVPSLPKSATSTIQSYLNCGMGYLEGVHQWTHRENETKPVRIGECMLDNIHRNRSVVEGCGDHKHWSDIGVVRPSMCYYPSVHGGLEAIYQAHPFGTILNTIRDARSWYESAKKWAKLLKRWSIECEGFPPLSANATDWIDFYNIHTQQIRDFARTHPTMTYVEVDVDNKTETRDILAENFAFPDRCWGHVNSNANDEAMIRHISKAALNQLANNRTIPNAELEWLRKRNVTLGLPGSFYHGKLGDTKE